MSHPLGDRKLAQIAFVVRDIEASKARWAALLGVDVPGTIVTDPGNAVNATYRGAPTNDQAKLAFFDLGGVQLELIEPMGTDSAWAEGLDSKGERFHHLAFCVESVAEAKEYLDGHGVTLIQRGDAGGGGGGEYAYFDGQEHFSAMIELLAAKRS
jgi:catechol 2,3-dioxygenase-like lactoylglutathione lyase family enzyme